MTNDWIEIKDNVKRLEKYKLLINDIDEETSDEVITSLLLGLDDPYELIRFECLNKVPLERNLILSYLESFFNILYTDSSPLVKAEAAILIKDIFEIKFINYLYEKLEKYSLERTKYMMTIALLERGTKNSIKDYTKLINDEHIPTRMSFIESSFYFKDDIGKRKLERMLEKRLKIEREPSVKAEIEKILKKLSS